MAEIVEGNELRDAALIASAQKLEHYEIAAYGTAAALAGRLNLRDDQKALHQILEEKKKADAVLTQLAKGEMNPGRVIGKRLVRIIQGQIWIANNAPRRVLRIAAAPQMGASFLIDILL